MDNCTFIKGCPESDKSCNKAKMGSCPLIQEAKKLSGSLSLSLEQLIKSASAARQLKGRFTHV